MTKAETQHKNIKQTDINNKSINKLWKKKTN